jgi:DNA-directed RNA polymerase specialized sigma24 family protein
MALAPDGMPTELEAVPVCGSVPHNTAHSPALDSAAMLDLHKWLNRKRFRLFGDLRSSDQDDAVAETFLRTLEFADRMRNPGALYGACFAIGLRVRAKRVTEYIRERRHAPPGVMPLVPWHPERRLFEKYRRTGALLAIRALRALDREILLRFYFEGQTQEEIQLEMQLSATQFRVRKNRAITRARLHARAILADVRISRYSKDAAEMHAYSFHRAIA